MVDMKQTERSLDERIAQNVRTLLAHTGIPREDVIDALGVSRSTWYDRMGAKSPWTAGEVDAAAQAFGVSVAEMYSKAPALPERRYVLRSTRNTGWFGAHIPQPRGHIGHGLLGSWDHHYIRSAA